MPDALRYLSEGGILASHVQLLVMAAEVYAVNMLAQMTLLYPCAGGPRARHQRRRLAHAVVAVPDGKRRSAVRPQNLDAARRSTASTSRVPSIRACQFRFRVSRYRYHNIRNIRFKLALHR